MCSSKPSRVRLGSLDWLELVKLDTNVESKNCKQAPCMNFFAADRSRRGKRCSSSCCCFGGGIFQSPMYSFLGWEKAKTLSQKGCEKAKTLSQKGCKKVKNCIYHGALICRKYYSPRRRSVKVSQFLVFLKKSCNYQQVESFRSGR